MADKYYRLVCFVVDICADVLRKYFVKLAKTDAGNTYTSVLAYLIQRHRDVKLLLQQKKIRQDQYNLMYPPSNGNADENQWDITLIVTLIVALFPIYETRAVSVIRDIRNKLQHHPNTRNISDDEFDDYWVRLETASMHIVNTCTVNPKDKAAFQDKISKAKCNNLPNIGDCLRSWYEERIKQMESTINEMGSTIKQMESTTKETNCILRKVTVKKPGPSGDKNKRLKVVDGILAKLQKGFESSIKNFPDDFNAPNEASGIRAKLRDCHHVVVTGCDNSRYFETALAAIKGMDYDIKRSVEMYTSSDWRHIDPEDVDLVLCRNPFGGFSYDESKAKAMGDIFNSMIDSTKAAHGDKTLDIVIVTDLEILEECKMHHDHEILDEVVKVFTDTSSTQPADLTIVMTSNFLKTYQISCSQVNADVLRNAKDKFKTHKTLVLKGPKNCEKTSVAVALTSAYESSQCLLLKKPNDVNYIDFANICLVIIDEFAGKYRYEENDVYEWYNMFDHLYNTVIAGQMNVIITCDKGKLEKCINEIGPHAILNHVVDVPLQTIVVKSEVTEQYGHVDGQLVTTHHSIGTISNTTKSKDYPQPLSVVPPHLRFLLSSHDTMIPVSTGNTSLLDRPQIEGIQNPMQLKRGLQSELSTETIDLSVKRLRSMSSGLWPVKVKGEINIKINGDFLCQITGSCKLPSGKILLADINNKRLKKLDNMYNVKFLCFHTDQPYDVCYVGEHVAVVSLLSNKLQFVDTKHSMTLIRSVDTDHECRGLACHGDLMYVRDIYGSIYSYSTDGIKQQMIYSSGKDLFPFNNIAASNDGGKLYLPNDNGLVTIDNKGKHLFTLNNLDIQSSCGVCVDEQGYVYVNGRNGNIIQINEDGRTIHKVTTNLAGWKGDCTRTLTFDRKNKAVIAAGISNKIRVLKLRKQCETQTR